MHKSILVLEESRMVHELIESALPEDYTSWEVNHETLPDRYLKKARETNPDIIFLSNQDQKRDYATVKQLKSSPVFSQTPILLLTSAKDSLDENLLQSIGVRGFVRKPFETSTLQKQITVVLKEQEQKRKDGQKDRLKDLNVVDDDLMDLLSGQKQPAVSIDELEEELDPTLQLIPEDPSEDEEAVETELLPMDDSEDLDQVDFIYDDADDDLELDTVSNPVLDADGTDIELEELDDESDFMDLDDDQISMADIDLPPQTVQAIEVVEGKGSHSPPPLMNTPEDSSDLGFMEIHVVPLREEEIQSHVVETISEDFDDEEFVKKHSPVELESDFMTADSEIGIETVHQDGDIEIPHEEIVEDFYEGDEMDDGDEEDGLLELSIEGMEDEFNIDTSANESEDMVAFQEFADSTDPTEEITIREMDLPTDSEDVAVVMQEQLDEEVTDFTTVEQEAEEDRFDGEEGIDVEIDFHSDPMPDTEELDAPEPMFSSFEEEIDEDSLSEGELEKRRSDQLDIDLEEIAAAGSEEASATIQEMIGFRQVMKAKYDLPDEGTAPQNFSDEAGSDISEDEDLFSEVEVSFAEEEEKNLETSLTEEEHEPSFELADNGDDISLTDDDDDDLLLAELPEEEDDLEVEQTEESSMEAQLTAEEHESSFELADNGDDISLTDDDDDDLLLAELPEEEDDLEVEQTEESSMEAQLTAEEHEPSFELADDGDDISITDEDDDLLLAELPEEEENPLMAEMTEEDGELSLDEESDNRPPVETPGATEIPDRPDDILLETSEPTAEDTSELDLLADEIDEEPSEGGLELLSDEVETDDDSEEQLDDINLLADYGEEPATDTSDDQDVFEDIEISVEEESTDKVFLDLDEGEDEEETSQDEDSDETFQDEGLDESFQDEDTDDDVFHDPIEAKGDETIGPLELSDDEESSLIMVNEETTMGLEASKPDEPFEEIELLNDDEAAGQSESVLQADEDVDEDINTLVIDEEETDKEPILEEPNDPLADSSTEDIDFLPINEDSDQEEDTGDQDISVFEMETETDTSSVDDIDFLPLDEEEALAESEDTLFTALTDDPTGDLDSRSDDASREPSAEALPTADDDNVEQDIPTGEMADSLDGADEITIEVPQETFEMSDFNIGDITDDGDADDGDQDSDNVEVEEQETEYNLMEGIETVSADADPETNLSESAEESYDNIELPTMDEDLPDLPPISNQDGMQENDAVDPHQELVADESDIRLMQTENDFDDFDSEQEIIGVTDDPTASLSDISASDREEVKQQAQQAAASLTPEFRKKLSEMIEGVVSETVHNTLQEKLPELVDRLMDEELKD